LVALAMALGAEGAEGDAPAYSPWDDPEFALEV